MLSQLEQLGKLPFLAELFLEVQVNSFAHYELEHDLDVARNGGGSQARIDQSIAVLQKSDVKTPKTLTVVFLVRDFERGPPGQRFWRQGATRTLTV